jgi:SPP1 gp7 family putative phage head morphogenesis protein
MADVKALVVRSVEAGRDVGGLEKDLRARYDVTRERARLIAKDQNNKATQDMAKAQCLDNGVRRAIWRHNAASKEPRQEHIAMNGKEFDLQLGCWDPVVGRHVQPGELVLCRCTFRPVLA